MKTFKNSIVTDQYFIGVAFNAVMMFVIKFWTALNHIPAWLVLENIY